MEITAATIDTIARAPLAARGETLLTAKPIAIGASSAVWRLTTETNTYALRLLTGRQSAAATRTDIHIRTQLRALRCAVASPVAHSSTATPPWILDRFVVGIHPPRGHLSPQVCRGIGHVLAHLHRLQCAGFGKPGTLVNSIIKGTANTPITGLETRFSSPLPVTTSQWATHPFHSIPDLHARLLPRLNRIIDHISDSPAVVCHTDLHERQFICHADQLHALIDFADVTIADRRWDFASLYYFHGSNALTAIVDAYCEDFAHSEDRKPALLSGARLFSLSIALHHAARSVLPRKVHRYDIALAHINRVLPTLDTYDPPMA